MLDLQSQTKWIVKCDKITNCDGAMTGKVFTQILNCTSSSVRNNTLFSLIIYHGTILRGAFHLISQKVTEVFHKVRQVLQSVATINETVRNLIQTLL